MKFNYYLNEAAAGSATTRLQEGLHCILFGAKQKRKKLDMSVFDDPAFLESAYNTYCSVDAPFAELYNFGVAEPGWAQSIIKATNVLFASDWMKGKYTFHRNDAYMNSIYQQFQRLAKQDGVKMGNDKWNPGDVWASKGMKIPQFDSLAEYNSFIAKNLHNGKLLGISLKKIAKNDKGKVVLEGDPAAEVKSVKFEGVKKPKLIFPTGTSIMIGGKYTINFRSFSISKNAKITGEIVKAGGGARHGKVPAGDKMKMINEYNIPQTPKQTLSKKSDAMLKNMVVDLWKQSGYSFSQKEIEASWEKKITKEGWMPESKKEQNRTGYWQSVINSLEIAAFLSAHKTVAHKIVDFWYKGAKSTGGSSSQFIKVY